MKEINILIVEDESIVAMEIEQYINILGYGNVKGICSNGKDTIKAIAIHDINIVLMDINIKGDIDGIETSSIIKKLNSNIEIIFITAHLDDYNVDRAIELNPVAYLSKPFNREELRVFLKIAIHKLKKESMVGKNRQNHIIFDDEFSYDIFTNTLYCCYEEIHLTKKEHQLIKIFIENINQTIDFSHIEDTIWEDKVVNSNTVRSLIKRMRQKLKHKFIETISSVGYKFRVEKK